jgi:hypothetical protein
MATDDQQGNVLKQHRDWASIFIPIAFVAIAIVVVIFIVVSISGSKGVLTSLADDKIARGLITFLIAIATVAIAIILALAAIISDPAVVKDRVTLGKEILGIMMGVLGTVVGFYFGSSVTGQQQPQPLQMRPAVITNEQPKKSEKTTIVGFVSGGKAPYVYSITFDPKILSVGDVKDVPSTDGIIKQDVQVPGDLQKDTSETFIIEVKDSESKSITYNKDGTKKFLMKAQ